MAINAFDVEIVRTAVGFATVHVPHATSLLDAQQQAADMAGDIVFSEKEATYEPVNGWAEQARGEALAATSDALQRSVFLLFEVPKDESSEEGDPVAVMVKLSLDKLVRLDAMGGIALSLDDCRWLKGIAFTDGVLSDVPGFFKSGQDVCVSIGEAFLIDSDQNNGVDFYGPQCECEPGERSTRIETMKEFQQTAQSLRRLPPSMCDHYFVEGHDSGGRLASYIYHLGFIFQEVAKVVDLDQALSFRGFAKRTLDSTSALVALVNANELRPRAPDQTLDDWLHQCLISEFECNMAVQDDESAQVQTPEVMQ